MSTDELLRTKIISLLKIYPKISPSMLQVGIGPSISSSMWRPILQQLKDDGIVIEDHFIDFNSSGRSQTFKIISLVENNVKVSVDHEVGE